MTDSSAQPSCSVTSIETIDLSKFETLTLSDTITVDLGNITLGSSGTSYTMAGYGGGGAGTYTISGGSMGGTGGGGAVGIGPITTSDLNFTWHTQEEWKDGFPDWHRIQEMCEMYPGLKIAFEKFKTTYKLVKDDYDAPPEKRIKP